MRTSIRASVPIWNFFHVPANKKVVLCVCSVFVRMDIYVRWVFYREVVRFESGSLSLENKIGTVKGLTMIKGT